jgi:hypothetical protein
MQHLQIPKMHNIKHINIRYMCFTSLSLQVSKDLVAFGGVII